MSVNSKLIILTGASGSGKTTLLNNLLFHKSKLFIRAPKYSTRDERIEENTLDDIKTDKNLNIETYDLIYTLNRERYGIKYIEIEELFNNKNHQVIVLSNNRIIKTLKKQFPNKVISIYVSSAIDDSKLIQIQFERYRDRFKLTSEELEGILEEIQRVNSSLKIENTDKFFEFMVNLNKNWKQLLPMYESTEIRQTKIRDFHKSYLENIHLYDFVVLNYRVDRVEENKGQDMTKQVLNIINNLPNKQKTNSKQSKLFVVIAASGAGKGELMQTINDSIKKDVIKILSKEAKRNPKNKDKRDGLIAIGKEGTFSEGYTFDWTFHKDENFSGVEYAINPSEITENFNNNIHQIVVSNFGQIEKFKNRYKDRVSFIYLHALRNEEDVENYQHTNNETIEEANARISEIKTVYDTFIENNHIFSHVLLNTTFLEDLYEQTFNLIQHYEI